MKVCSTCKIEKELTEFHKKLNYLQSLCKNCQSIYLKKYRLKNKEILKEKSKIYVENNKEIIKQKQKESHKKYYLENKEIIKEKNKIYQKENNRIEYHKQYRLKNKEKIKEYHKQHNLNNRDKKNEYYKNKRLLDNLFDLKIRIRQSIRVTLKRQNFNKNSKTSEILGCSIQEFKNYLELQFTKGMTWENAVEWHLDHIYPVSLAKNEEELIRLNHYTNFQPLWAKDNLQKSNKIIDNKQLKLI